VMRMNDKRTHKRIWEWKVIGTRTTGRPRKRWIEGHWRRFANNGSKTVDKAMRRKGRMEENHWEGENPQWVVTPIKEEENYVICFLLGVFPASEYW
jgi:hypothetical protein